MKKISETEFSFEWGDMSVYNSFNRVTITMKVEMTVDSLEIILNEVKKINGAAKYTMQILNLV